METNITSSFIPTDATNFASRKQNVALYDVMLMLASILLVASGALAVAVFLYSQYLTADMQSKKAQVERAQKAFEPSLMLDITRLDDRMHAADILLQNHVASSAFFSFLEASTLQTVSFKTLQFELIDLQKASLKMTGVAQSVNSIALQADLFTKGGALSSPLFSNIARQEDGVHFDLVATINPETIKYVRTLDLQSSTQVAPAETQQEGTPSSLTPPSPSPRSL